MKFQKFPESSSVKDPAGIVIVALLAVATTTSFNGSIPLLFWSIVD